MSRNLFEMRWRVEYFIYGCPMPCQGSCLLSRLETWLHIYHEMSSLYCHIVPMGIENSNNWPTREWGFFIQKRSSGNKIWQICPFSALWNNAGAACFCDSLNPECLVIRGAQCGGFHHFWPELLSYLSSSSLLIPRVTAISLLLGSGSVFIGGCRRCVGNDC